MVNFLLSFLAILMHCRVGRNNYDGVILHLHTLFRYHVVQLVFLVLFAQIQMTSKNCRTPFD